MKKIRTLIFFALLLGSKYALSQNERRQIVMTIDSIECVDCVSSGFFHLESGLILNFNPTSFYVDTLNLFRIKSINLIVKFDTLSFFLLKVY